jgi:hypothetical protein
VFAAVPAHHLADREEVVDLCAAPADLTIARPYVFLRPSRKVYETVRNSPQGPAITGTNTVSGYQHSCPNTGSAWSRIADSPQETRTVTLDQPEQEHEQPRSGTGSHGRSSRLPLQLTRSVLSVAEFEIVPDPAGRSNTYCQETIRNRRT